MAKYKLKNKRFPEFSSDSIKRKRGETVILPTQPYLLGKNWYPLAFLSFMATLYANFFFFESLEKLLKYDKDIFLKTFVVAACFLGFGVLIFGSTAFFFKSLFRLIFAWRVRSQEIVLLNYPLRIGEIYDIKFRLRMWGWSNLKQVKVISSVANEECVTYPASGSQTGSVTRTCPHWQFEFPEIVLSRINDSYEGHVQLNIPEESTIPSIYSPHNKVQWRLHLDWSFPDFGDKRTSHIIKVLPKREKQ